jgi:hypothetical protein
MQNEGLGDPLALYQTIEADLEAFFTSRMIFVLRDKVRLRCFKDLLSKGRPALLAEWEGVPTRPDLELALNQRAEMDQAVARAVPARQDFDEPKRTGGQPHLYPKGLTGLQSGGSNFVSNSLRTCCQPVYSTCMSWTTTLTVTATRKRRDRKPTQRQRTPTRTSRGSDPTTRRERVMDGGPPDRLLSLPNIVGLINCFNPLVTAPPSLQALVLQRTINLQYFLLE